MMFGVLVMLTGVGSPDRWMPPRPPTDVIRVHTYSDEHYNLGPLEWLLARGPVVGAWPPPLPSEHHHSTFGFRLGPPPKYQTVRLVTCQGPELLVHPRAPRVEFDAAGGPDEWVIRFNARERGGVNWAACDGEATHRVSLSLPGMAGECPIPKCETAALAEVVAAGCAAETAEAKDRLARATRDHPRPEVRAYSRWLRQYGDDAVSRSLRAAD